MSTFDPYYYYYHQPNYPDPANSPFAEPKPNPSFDPHAESGPNTSPWIYDPTMLDYLGTLGNGKPNTQGNVGGTYVPEKPKPPTPPSPEDPEGQRRIQEAERLQRNLRGRAATYLTPGGVRGLLSDPNLFTRSLLGS